MNGCSKIALISFFVCLFYSLNGQVVPHQKYTSKDGLISDRISIISQDNNGMMWFGSIFGICRYNGQYFEKLPLLPQQEQKSVTGIIPFKNAVFAGFGFNGGLGEFTRGKIIPYSFKNNQQENSLTPMCIADSSVLALAGYKLYMLSNGRSEFVVDLTKCFDSPVLITSMLHQPTQLWVGTNSGLYLFEKKNKKIFFLKKVLTGTNITSLCEDANKNIWIEGAADGIQTVGFCTPKGGYESYKVLMKSSQIIPVTYNSNGSDGFWGINYSKGLFHLSADRTVSYYPGVVDLNSYISYIYSDRENNIWIGNDPGVIKISLLNSRSFYFDKVAAAAGHLTIKSNGSILACNSKDLFVIAHDKIEKWPEFMTKEDKGLMGTFAEIDDHSIWCNRWDVGLWRLSMMKNKPIVAKKYFKTFNGEEIHVSALIKGQGNTFWAGGDKLYRLDDKKIVEVIELPKVFNRSVAINAIAIDTTLHELFIGDNVAGIFRLKYEELPGKSFRYSFKNTINEKDGLFDSYIRSLLVDSKGNLWAGTRYAGIFKMNLRDSSIKAINYNKNISLGCGRVTGITEEAGEAVWFSTCNGAHRFVYNSGGWEHYNTSYGLPSAEVFDIALNNDRKISWVLTNEGVTSISYKNKLTKVAAPIVNLTGVYVLGENDTASLYSTRLVKYPSSKNSIGFTFCASTFVDEKNVRYRYKLDGYSQEWSEPAINSNITYASLPPGHYTFKVEAENASGKWSDTPAVFSFEIVRPFYKSPWFLTSLLFALAIIIYGIITYRLQQKVKVEKLRVRIARDLHDDIGSALGSINLLSKSATRKLQRTEAGDEIVGTFEKIGDSAQTILESMDDIIWSINPMKDNWQDLVIRMKEFAIPLLESKDIKLDMQVKGEDYNRLPMDLRRNIFLIFKESISNTVKHSGCTQVNVTSRISHNNFYLEISDDGFGFDICQDTNRNGLKNLSHRATEINGRIVIKSEIGKGTSIYFQCPLR